MIWSAVKEMGIGWLACRTIYSAKLFLLRRIPSTEKLYEKKVNIKRIDILPDNTENIERFVKSLPDKEKEELIKSATAAVSGKIKGFSSVDMDYGNPINWQLSPLTGKSCSSKEKWFRIPDFDADRGDIKAVWEISRFSHLVTLARAYMLNSDRKYYEAFSQQLDNWLKENPYSYGANYKCGQECALRMMNALLAYQIFKSKGISTEQDSMNMEELVSRCYKKILSNFFYAYRCIRNNHTISELVGMIIGAWCCEDSKRLKKAYRMLDKVIAKQFTADGGYTQFSFNYQRLALQDLEYALRISVSTGINMSEMSIERIKNSVMLMYQCQDESGDVPNYGYNDGALIFQVSASGYRDFRPVIGSLYASLFKKRLYPEGAYDEEYLWLGTQDNISTMPLAENKRVSSSFPAAGLFTVRNERNDSWMMTVLSEYKTRPSHMDQLHVDLWKNGENLLCDSGTYSYADESGTDLVLTEAHNTVKLAATEQMNKQGKFMILDRTKRCSWDKEDSGFVGTFSSQNGYSHTRRITLCDNEYRIVDELRSKSDMQYDIVFHTPCEVQCKDGIVELYNKGRHVASLKSTLKPELSKGIRSLYYLAKESISVIRFRGETVNATAQSLVTIEINEEEL